MVDLFKRTIQSSIDFKQLGRLTQQYIDGVGKSRLKITSNDLRNWNDKEKARRIHEKISKNMGRL